MDYEMAKKHFADHLAKKLADEPEGRGQFESAFYSTIKLAYLAGVCDGRAEMFAEQRGPL